MSFNENLDYKKKAIFGIIVLIIGILFVYFTTGMSRASAVPHSEATYALIMSIVLLAPSIILLIPRRNEGAADTIKYIIYFALGIYIVHILRLLPSVQGPFFGYCIVALLFMIPNFVCAYIR
jgi:hypothetical protein